MERSRPKYSAERGRHKSMQNTKQNLFLFDPQNQITFPPRLGEAKVFAQPVSAAKHRYSHLPEGVEVIQEDPLLNRISAVFVDSVSQLASMLIHVWMRIGEILSCTYESRSSTAVRRLRFIHR